MIECTWKLIMERIEKMVSYYDCYVMQVLGKNVLLSSIENNVILDVMKWIADLDGRLDTLVESVALSAAET